MFRLSAVGGMCNRMAAILGYQSIYGDIQVVWRPEDTVGFARWGDLFEEIPGVEFLDDAGSWDEESYHAPENAHHAWERLYAYVCPAYAIATELAKTLAEVCAYEGGYQAIHVRRTDWTPMAHLHKCYRSDEEFISWARGGHGMVYLATDNVETRTKLGEAIAATNPVLCWPGEITGTEAQGEHDRKRHSTMPHAVADLFMCVNARRFLGTPGSTFSDTIIRIRKVRGLQ